MADRLTEYRRQFFHEFLKDQGVLSIHNGVASNADASSRTSKAIGAHIGEALCAPEKPKLVGQLSGNRFEYGVQHFLIHTMDLFQHVRPATWRIENFGNSINKEEDPLDKRLAGYEPFTHLARLADMAEQNGSLEASLGNSYEIRPDIVVIRKALSDDELNQGSISDPIVGPGTGNYSIIRRANHARDIVHALVSCKWTIRSDRAQNSRAEALNIIRNRKGRTPHIAVVTGEPHPSRIASLARGTGDIDMVYHFALPELIAAVQSVGSDKSKRTLNTLIEGQRLRDIGDLVLDLLV